MQTKNFRHKETFKTLQEFVSHTSLPSQKRYLDFGCGDGTFTLAVAELLGSKEAFGADLDLKVVETMPDFKFKTFSADFNTCVLPFSDNEFDTVTAFEVIEHLWNTDNLLSEACRVLKQGGFLVLTTPNLASWINRMLLLFGYLPYHYECSLTNALDKRPLQNLEGAVESHLRLYTFKTLSRHLEIYGFRIVCLKKIDLAYTSRNRFVRLFNKLFSLRRTMGAGIFLVAVKS
jgi:ubiquinone/menaquinone biosynthesis C-methylase UbiE